MERYVAVFMFEDKEVYTRKYWGNTSVDVDLKLNKYPGEIYGSAVARFTCPITNKAVTMRMGLANHGRSKALKRIKRTLNSYLDTVSQAENNKRQDSIVKGARITQHEESFRRTCY